MYPRRKREPACRRELPETSALLGIAAESYSGGRAAGSRHMEGKDLRAGPVPKRRQLPKYRHRGKGRVRSWGSRDLRLLFTPDPEVPGSTLELSHPQ